MNLIQSQIQLINRLKSYGIARNLQQVLSQIKKPPDSRSIIKSKIQLLNGPCERMLPNFLLIFLPILA